MLNPILRARIVNALLGFSSGLPLALTGSTLQAWFTVSGISLLSIGLLSLIGQAYIYKFLWAPLLDRYIPPLFGRRRGWLLITQCALILGIFLISLGSPLKHPFLLSFFATLVAFFSASQDSVIDAYRTEISIPEERGLNSALYSVGFRLAMIVSGGVALISAQLIGWHATYLLMSLFMFVGVLASVFAEEPVQTEGKPGSLKEAIVEPFHDFLSRPSAIIFLLLILFYKVGDALSLSLTTPFLIRGLGFSLITVGSVNKIFGVIASIVGVLLGGVIMKYISLWRSLFWFCLLQIIAIVMLWQLAVIGHNYHFLVLAVVSDNLFNGMGSVALVAFMMSLCNLRYTATQFALLSAFAAVPRVFIGPIAALMVTHMGWPDFFIACILVSLPGLFMLWIFRNRF